MKKGNIILSIFLSLIIIFSSSVFGYNLTTTDQKLVDSVIKKVSKKPKKQQTNLIDKIENILHSKKKLSVRTKNVLQEIEDRLRKQNLYSYDTSEKQSKQLIKKFHLNIPKIRQDWLGYLNGARKSYGLSSFSYTPKLDYTSQLWSNQAFKRGYIDHKIDTGDSYYDYWKKADRMKENGVTCKNVNKATFSESIAWGDIFCDGTNDCQRQLSDSVKTVYDMFMAEKGLPYPQDAHYRAIVHKDFNTIGLAFTLKHRGGHWYTYYLTNHYCTQLIENK